MYKKDKIVIHCKSCLMTNQKPFSINETKNKSSNQNKSTLQFNVDGVCSACHSIEAKKILIGNLEKKSFGKFVIFIDPKKENTTV